MKKRLLSVLLCLAMLLTFLPAVSLAAEEPTIDRPSREVASTPALTDDQIAVAGVILNKGEYLDTAGNVTTTAPASGGYALWKGDNILTLHNFEYEGPGYVYDTVDDYSSLVYATCDFMVRCTGENTLSNTDTEGDCITAYGGAVNITGTGTLNLSSAYPIYGWDTQSTDDYWDASSGAVRIDGLTLNIAGNTAVPYIDISIYSDNGIEIDSCEINIATTGEDANYGICSEYANVTVTDSYIDAYTYNDVIWGDTVYLTGSDVYFSSIIYGIGANDLFIDDCNIIGMVYGDNENNWDPSAAVCAYDTLTVDNAHIVIPADAEIKTVTFEGNDSSYEMDCICDPETDDYATFVAISRLFDDVPTNAFYTDAVYWANLAEITKGMTPTTFEPLTTCTRGHAVTFLTRLYGGEPSESAENPFTDVAAGRFYYKPVLYAVENGITNGMTPTTFVPDKTCTRGEIVTFLWRAAGKPEASDIECPFDDVSEGRFYYDAVMWAVELGITNGITPTTFEPDKTCTRGEIVTFLYRFATYQPPQE